MNEVTIKASDGRLFTGTIDTYGSILSKVKAHEADLELKKKKEEEKNNEAAKAFKELEDMAESLSVAVKEYELATKDNTYFYKSNGKLKIGKYTTLSNGLIKNIFGI